MHGRHDGADGAHDDGAADAPRVLLGRGGQDGHHGAEDQHGLGHVRQLEVGVAMEAHGDADKERHGHHDQAGRLVEAPPAEELALPGAHPPVELHGDAEHGHAGAIVYYHAGGIQRPGPLQAQQGTLRPDPIDEPVQRVDGGGHVRPHVAQLVVALAEVVQMWPPEAVVVADEGPALVLGHLLCGAQPPPPAALVGGRHPAAAATSAWCRPPSPRGHAAGA
mmetsp:Transcript_34574/g.78118  ORF Transcript_34574/g.78118 Transcript_34574/m.78118 type:complete len:221 (+) Transcript_34574:273-935(+)